MPASTTTTTTEYVLFEDSLFEDKYLSPEVQSNLHEGYKLYPLRANDFERGYLDVLSVLTEVGAHTVDTWNSQYQFMKKHNDTCKCFPCSVNVNMLNMLLYYHQISPLPSRMKSPTALQLLAPS